MSDRVWIDPITTLALHERLPVLHGGAAGVRDEGLLLSALARPQYLAAYVEDADLIDLAPPTRSGL